MNNRIITLQEHQSCILTDEDKKVVSICIDTNEYLQNKQQYLGIDWNMQDRTHSTLQACYYVGACWLDETTAIEVTPKIPHLDYMQMFMKCFDRRDKKIQDAFKKIYCIDFDKPLIEVRSQDIQLTPILLVHFLKLMEQLVAHGLKSNFIHREETMYGKMKGKLLLAQTINQQIVTGRQDITICQYQEYSTDCIENRILKKALQYTLQYLKSHQVSSSRSLLQVAHRCWPLFAEVGDNITSHDVQHYRVNPLYRDYAEALKVAKLLLRRFDYSIDNTTDVNFDKKTPPFWIDMSILFELYVLSELKQSYKDIWYQSSFNSGRDRIDFCHPVEKLILDTKYSLKWETDNMVTDNIRQLSGYARNSELRYAVQAKAGEILPCMILYPSSDGIEHFSSAMIMDESKKKAISAYERFFKLPIKLPILL